MNNKKFKKSLAVVLAGTMTLGMGVTALAADTPAGQGSGTGAGELEGHVEKSVLEVTLPTDGDTGTFGYTIDPEGLIAATQAAKYPGTTYDSSTGVYFQTSEKNYTDKSAKLKVTNKGNVDADVTVDVSVASGSGITAMKGKDGFTEAGAAELYLGLLVNDDAGVAVNDFGSDAGKKATKTVGLKGRPANFDVKYDSDADKYSYAIKDGVAETAWNSFEFGLEGACNTKGDYSAESFAVPTVTVTWSYIAHPETGGAAMLEENASTDVAPSIATTGIYDKATGVITVEGVNLGAGEKVTTLRTAKYGSTLAKATTDVAEATITGTTFTGKVSDAVKSGWANLAGPVYVVITFADGTTGNVTLSMQ
ncbi:hypothetical protein C817_01341 [Dorea sp. 5-2]|nr:hypothetical protein C817_01341 [Dorea sp. 5-2]